MMLLSLLYHCFHRRWIAAICYLMVMILFLQGAADGEQSSGGLRKMQSSSQLDMLTMLQEGNVITSSPSSSPPSPPPTTISPTEAPTTTTPTINEIQKPLSALVIWKIGFSYMSHFGAHYRTSYVYVLYSVFPERILYIVLY